MFKLIKLAFYVVIGYALYELYLGFTEGGQGMGGGEGPRKHGAIHITAAASASGLGPACRSASSQT